MTESEALKILKRDLQIQKDNKALPDGIESLEIAIKSLEEVQAYRAIGTVEELKSMKENGSFSGVELALIAVRLNELKEYKKIGTIERFRELTEKAEPKKAIGKKYIEAYCPTCKEVISDGEFWLLDEDVHYCNNCGQAVMYVDWE